MNKPKFRAWDKNDKKMIDWEYLINYCDIDYLFGGYDGGFGKEGPKSYEYPIPMQYTGLKDNSEEPIEIWQKSIVKIVNNDGDYFIGVVEYFGDQGYPAFDIDCKYYKDWHFDSNVLSEALGNDNLKIYVIGDEYSNPELLNEVE